jgi:hypothetical protein
MGVIKNNDVLAAVDSRRRVSLAGLVGLIVLLVASNAPFALSYADAAGCSWPGSNCVIDIDVDPENAVIFNDRMTYLSCWSGTSISYLEAKDGSNWVTVSKSKVKKNAPRCKNSDPKFPNLHTHVWQVDIIPLPDQDLQMRVRSGSYVDNWLTPVYKSVNDRLSKIAGYFDIIDKSIKDTGK